MTTIRLRVNNKVYKNLMWFLNRFSKKEIQIIEENDEFLSIQDYLKNELTSVENENAEYIDIKQLDVELEATISKYEA